MTLNLLSASIPANSAEYSAFAAQLSIAHTIALMKSQKEKGDAYAHLVGRTGLPNTRDSLEGVLSFLGCPKL